MSDKSAVGAQSSVSADPVVSADSPSKLKHQQHLVDADSMMMVSAQAACMICHVPGRSMDDTKHADSPVLLCTLVAVAHTTLATILTPLVLANKSWVPLLRE